MITSIPIPEQLEQELRVHAVQRQVSIEQLVREAVAWYVRFDPSLLDELDAWQDIRDEAGGIAESPIE
jgi:hypothetical protein